MEREKLRIRWYGSKKTEYNNFQIQIKSKNNLVGFKDILRISDDDYDELDCKQIYSQIANIHNIDRNISGKFLARLLNQIKIVKIVYSRDYYYSDQLNCRLTVDTQICAYPMQKVLRSRVRKYSFSNKIVELKYDVAEIESVSNYLSEIRVTNVGFSKYTQGVAGLIQKVVL